MTECRTKVRYIKRLQRGQRGFTLVGNTFKAGTKLTYFFDGGTDLERNVVRHSYQKIQSNCSLTFEEVDNRQDASFRIGFVPDGTAWSWMGTDNLSRPDSENTMNFGWDIVRDPGTSDHETGHSVGLPHEHTHPDFPVQLNKPVIESEMLSRGWTMQDIINNIYNQYDHHEVENVGAWDIDSVMLYGMDASWDLNGVGLPWNDKFSLGDFETMRRAYGSPVPLENNVYLDALRVIYDSIRIKALYKREHVKVAQLFGLSTEGKELEVIGRIKEYLGN